MFTPHWTGNDTADNPTTPSHPNTTGCTGVSALCSTSFNPLQTFIPPMQATGSFPSRFLLSAMGQDLIYLITPLSHTSLAATAAPGLMVTRFSSSGTQSITSPHSMIFLTPWESPAPAGLSHSPQFSFHPSNHCVHSKAGSLSPQVMPVPWKDRKLLRGAESGNAPDTGKKEETPHNPL